MSFQLGICNDKFAANGPSHFGGNGDFGLCYGDGKWNVAVRSNGWVGFYQSTFNDINFAQDWTRSSYIGIARTTAGTVYMEGGSDGIDASNSQIHAFTYFIPEETGEYTIYVKHDDHMFVGFEYPETTAYYHAYTSTRASTGTTFKYDFVAGQMYPTTVGLWEGPGSIGLQLKYSLPSEEVPTATEFNAGAGHTMQGGLWSAPTSFSEESEFEEFINFEFGVPSYESYIIDNPSVSKKYDPYVGIDIPRNNFYSQCLEDTLQITAVMNDNGFFQSGEYHVFSPESNDDLSNWVTVFGNPTPQNDFPELALNPCNTILHQGYQQDSGQYIGDENEPLNEVFFRLKCTTPDGISDYIIWDGGKTAQEQCAEQFSYHPNTERYWNTDEDSRPSLGLFSTIEDNLSQDNFTDTLADTVFTQVPKPNLIENGAGRSVKQFEYLTEHLGANSYKPTGGWDYLVLSGVGTYEESPEELKQKYLQNDNFDEYFQFTTNTETKYYWELLHELFEAAGFHSRSQFLPGLSFCSNYFENKYGLNTSQQAIDFCQELMDLSPDDAGMIDNFGNPDPRISHGVLSNNDADNGIDSAWEISLNLAGLCLDPDVDTNPPSHPEYGYSYKVSHCREYLNPFNTSDSYMLSSNLYSVTHKPELTDAIPHNDENSITFEYIQEPENPPFYGYAGYYDYIPFSDEFMVIDGITFDPTGYLDLQWASWQKSGECHSFNKCLRFYADDTWDNPQDFYNPDLPAVTYEATYIVTDRMGFSSGTWSCPSVHEGDTYSAYGSTAEEARQNALDECVSIAETGMEGVGPWPNSSLCECVFESETNNLDVASSHPSLITLGDASNNEYRVLNQNQLIYDSFDNRQRELNPFSSLRVSFWMKTITSEETLLNKPSVEVGIVPVRQYLDYTGNYNSLKEYISTEDPISYDLNGMGRFSNNVFDIWEKFEFEFNLNKFHTADDGLNVNNLYFVIQSSSATGEGFRGTVWLDDFEVVESYNFQPDVDVRKRKGPDEYGLADLTKYYDKDLQPEQYKDTTAPLEVQFYFYPRYYYNDILDKARGIIFKDFSRGMFYLQDVDWGDGSPNEFVDNPELLGDNISVYHTYKNAGIYEIKGTMLRMKPDKDFKPSGIIHNKRFTLRINVNEELDEDFTYFGSEGFSFIPYKNTLPIVGGISSESIYYKNIKRQLGILSDDEVTIVDFKNQGDKLKTQLAMDKIDSTYSDDFELLNAFKTPRWETKELQQAYNLFQDTFDFTAFPPINNGIQTNSDELGESIGDLDITNVRYFNTTMEIWQMLGFNDIVVNGSPFINEDAPIPTEGVSLDDWLNVGYIVWEFDTIPLNTETMPEGISQINSLSYSADLEGYRVTQTGIFNQSLGWIGALSEIQQNGVYLFMNKTNEDILVGNYTIPPTPPTITHHPGNPLSNRYWKKIIPEDYSIFERSGIFLNENNEYVMYNHEDVQYWNDNSYVYPVLPRHGADGKFRENIYPTDAFGDPISQFPSDGPITDEKYYNQNLKISLVNKQKETNVFDDESGNKNYGFVISDYRTNFDNETLEPKKTKNFTATVSSRNKGAF